MWNYTALNKKAYAGNIQGFNIPNGHSKHDKDEPAVTADDIFSHLNNVKDSDNSELPPVNMLTDDSGSANDAQTSANLTEDTSKYTTKTAAAGDYEDAAYTAYDGTTRTTPLTYANAIKSFGRQAKGLLADSFKVSGLGKVNDVVRKMSFNSPLIRAGLVGTAGWLAGRYAIPEILRRTDKLLPFKDKDAVERDIYGKPIVNEQDAKWLGGVTAAALGIASLIPSIDTRRPYWGLGSFRKKASNPDNSCYVRKYANMYNSFDSFGIQPAIPLGAARAMIAGNTDMNPITRMEAMDVLNAIPNQNPDTPITGKAIIGTAISNGLSAVSDAAIGYITANALGLSNPAGIAKTTGAASFILRSLT